MKPTIVLLPYAVSANRYWRTVVIGNRALMVPTKEAKAYKTEVAWRVRAAGLKQPVQGWVMLSMVLHPVEPKDAADRARKMGPGWHLSCRCLDVDNAVKVTLDALQGVLYVNDAQVFALSIQRGLPTPDGGLTVTMTIPNIEEVEQSPQLTLPVEDDLPF